MIGTGQLMGSEPCHEAAATSTVFQICFNKMTNLRWMYIRTLIARIHSAFSLVLNALHSLRTAGFVHRYSSYENTLSADQRKDKRTERSLQANISGRDVV